MFFFFFFVGVYVPPWARPKLSHDALALAAHDAFLVRRRAARILFEEVEEKEEETNERGGEIFWQDVTRGRGGAGGEKKQLPTKIHRKKSVRKKKKRRGKMRRNYPTVSELDIEHVASSALFSLSSASFLSHQGVPAAEDIAAAPSLKSQTSSHRSTQK